MRGHLLFLPFRWVCRKDRDRAALLMLLDPLAAAVKHDMPVVAALRALIREGSLLRSQSPRSVTWYRIIRKVTTDVERGKTLCTSLDRRLGRYFPCHYRSALLHAEAQGRLKTVLPIVADAMHSATGGRLRWKAALAYPLIMFWTTFTLASGLFVFIVPKFVCLLEEVGAATDVPPMRLLQTLKDMVWFVWLQVLGWLPVLVPLFVCLKIASAFRWLSLGLAWVAEPLLLAVPVVGRQTKRVALLEFTQALSVFVAGGTTLNEAAEFGLKASCSPWMRRRVARFIEDVEKGEYWAEAWERMGAGTAFHTWIIRNAAARNDPASGFRLLQEWLGREVDRTRQRFLVWVEPCGVAINSAFVGGIVYGLFGVIVQVLWGALGMEP